MNIYQLFVRIFGNKNKEIQFNGTKNRNGCGTFADIDDVALDALRDLGITHIWLTGIIRHSTLTAYPDWGLEATHPQITKGIAGSPYSILDYYDVDPDLAVNPEKRMTEFVELVQRIHNHGLKVIMDFIPNHLAREYSSKCKPPDVENFGVHDNQTVAFSRDNNFYYCPQQKFVSPNKGFTNDDNIYNEYPAKVSGNNVFAPNPSSNDWYDTIKLNYGVDYQNNKTYFNPIPDTWLKMMDIMNFWCIKDVDGFRVDMAEMVPVEFWQWMIYKLRKSFKIIMIAEIYQPHLYKDYLNAGFDFLYDKVGLYNTIENIYRYGQNADTLSDCWKDLDGLDDKMLRFMENHDEVRLASKHFIGNSFKALPGVVVSALMNRGPFMIHNGQESGENAENAVGFSGDDGRTSIFDYVSMPKHQAWMNNGAFDGGKFNAEQKKLFDIYSKLLNFRLKSDAINKGAFYDLMWANTDHLYFDSQFVYAFLRYYKNERLLIAVNFNRNESRDVKVKIPEDALKLMYLEDKEGKLKEGINIKLGPAGFRILSLCEEKYFYL